MRQTDVNIQYYCLFYMIISNLFVYSHDLHFKYARKGLCYCRHALALICAIFKLNTYFGLTILEYVLN